MNITKTVRIELNKQDLIDLVEAGLKSKGLPSSVKKLQYDSTMSTVLVESTETEGHKVDMKFVEPESTKIRNNPGGYRKKNFGFKASVRDLIQDYRNKKQHKVAIDEIVKEIQFFFPEMSDTKIIQYLQDHRQFPNVTLNRNEGVVQL